MEECMICYDTNMPYQLKGCKHSICIKCAEKLQSVPTCIQHPFKNKVTVLLPVHDVILKCPYCTLSEPPNYSIDQLRRQFPHHYRIWVETEMRYSPHRGYTHVSVADEVKYANSKRRRTEVTRLYFGENDIIDYIGELRPLKITYTDPYSKYQVHEKRPLPIQRRPKHC